ncbi:TIGR00295 family protein [Archaeoglobales archaeon]|nr:MAG: TIGR00295 family protein [Archaeoglobales archaeon]
MRIPEIVRKIWDKYGLDRGVREHCIAVAKLSLKIAEKIEKNGHKIDMDSILIGALLHDIGRATTNAPFLHFVKSGEILRAEGLNEKIVKIAERHFSAGLSKEDALKLGIPPKDYIPESLEEKIVSLADNLILNSRVISFKRFIQRLDEIDKKNPELKWFTAKSKKRAERIRREIEELSGLRF